MHSRLLADDVDCNSLLNLVISDLESGRNYVVSQFLAQYK